MAIVAKELAAAQNGPESTSNKRTLRSLDGVRPLYILPADPLAEEALIPGFKNSTKVDCMAGFFSSEVLASLAPGLATFVNESQDSFRLIVSPILRAEDQAAIEEGLKNSEDIVCEILDEIILTEDLLQQHTLRCLSWLLRYKRIEIKIALMKDALFHPKVWLFENSADVVAVHGSSNVTYAGIKKNIEQIAVSKSWDDPNQRYITEKLAFQFRQLWDDREENCLVISLPQAVRDKLLKKYHSDSPPTETELRALYARAENSAEGSKPVELSGLETPAFSIPEYLKYTEGPFEHQGKAVNAWCDAGYRGVLEMATGSGKTITAMICAYRLYEEHRPLLIVVSAPYLPLVQQWCDEIKPFGLRPINLTLANGARGRAQELNRIKRRFRGGSSDVEVIVITHNTLCDSAFHSEVKKFDCSTFLIADEAHNLGREGFVTNSPDFFNFRLGLSATPVRQYDEEGTEALFKFFGDVVFQFTLKEAIGRCLVEYDYFVHPVELTHDEMDDWYDLTSKIKANAWRNKDNKPDDYLAKLFRDRRALLETAENKIQALETLLQKEDISALRHTLIYASDKGPEQLEQVNALLKSRGILFHQLTHEETQNREKTAEIIRSFQDGLLRVLTAKRVLDEGVNIPQIQKAYILASTTVERQWVQRRGRLLRKCDAIGKTYSEIHDFIAIPPELDTLDDEAKTLVRSELLRVQEFASLARNAGRQDGPLNVIDKLVRAVFI